MKTLVVPRQCQHTHTHTETDRESERSRARLESKRKAPKEKGEDKKEAEVRRSGCLVLLLRCQMRASECKKKKRERCMYGKMMYNGSSMHERVCAEKKKAGALSHFNSQQLVSN